MFGGLVRHSVTVSLDFDPAADDVLALWRAPKACTIKGAYAVCHNAVAANTANYFSLNLLNGGSAGTATTAIGGTVGGTAGWAALTSKTLISSDVSLAAGDWVVANYDEEGTGTFAGMVVQIDYEF